MFRVRHLVRAISRCAYPIRFSKEQVRSGRRGRVFEQYVEALEPRQLMSALPSPLLDSDIGNPDLTGSADYNSTTGAITVQGAGNWTWYSNDQFHYVYQPLIGDGTIIAKVDSIDPTDAWAKAGIMVRQNLSNAASHADMLITYNGNAEFQYRTPADPNQTYGDLGTGATPYWVKAVVSGSTINGYASADGTNWTLVGSTTLQMVGAYYVGLMVCSGNGGSLNTSTFSNLSITGDVPDQLPSEWMQADVGSPNLAGEAYYASGTFTLSVSGGGGGIQNWTSGDQMHMVYQSLDGNGSITAHVAGQSKTFAWPQAGVVIRSDLTTDAPNVGMLASYTNEGSPTDLSTARVTAGGGTYSEFAAADSWVRITRLGDIVTTYNSADGITWNQVDTFTPDFEGTVDIGLVVSSLSPDSLNTAAFDNVSVVRENQPGVSILGASTGSQSNQYTLSLMSNVNDLTSWTINWGDGTTQFLDGFPSSVQHVYQTAGSYAINAQAEGTQSYTAVPLNVTIAAESTAPVVNITSPANNTNLTTSNPTITGTAGTLNGDSNDVLLQVFAGTSDTGTLLQTIAATRDDLDGNFSLVIPASQPLANGQYTLKAVQKDDAGNTGTSSLVEITISNAFTTNVSNLSLVSETSSSVFLTWNGPDGNPFLITRTGPDGTVTFTTTSTAYLDNNVQPNAAYLYTIAPQNSIGTSMQISAHTTADNGDGSTKILDIQAPSITSFTSSTLTDSSITLNWLIGSGGADRIELSRDGELIATLNGNQTAYSDTGLAANSTHVYSLAAFDSAENASAAGSLTLTTNVDAHDPSMVINLRAPVAMIKDGSLPATITLAWDSPSDSAGVVGYVVTRNGTYLFSPTSPLTDTTFTDSSIPDSWTGYNYTVAALDSQGNISAAVTIVLAPTNGTDVLGSALTLADQYIPKSYKDYFYNVLTARLRELESAAGGTAPTATSWFDTFRGAVINGQIASLPTIPSGYFYDENQNNLYDASELAWIGHQQYQAGDTVLGETTPPLNLLGTPGLRYLPASGTAYEPGDELLTNITLLQGQMGDYDYRDLPGLGYWILGDPIWKDTNHNDIFDSGEPILYDNNGTVTLPVGAFGKANGIYAAQTSAGQLIWVDSGQGMNETSLFAKDFNAFYTALQSLLPSFASADDPSQPWNTGSLLASLGINDIAGNGSIGVDVSGTVTGAGTAFGTQIHIGDWIQVGNNFYNVTSVISANQTLTVAGYHGGALSGQAYNFVNWTRTPSFSDATNSLAFQLELGVPQGGTSRAGAIFPIQFTELHNALDALSLNDGAPLFQFASYDTARFDESTIDPFLQVAHKIVDAYVAVYGSAAISQDSFAIALQNHLVQPGDIFHSSYLTDLQNMVSAIARVIYVRNGSGWRNSNTSDAHSAPLTFSSILNELLPTIQNGNTTIRTAGMWSSLFPTIPGQAGLKIDPEHITELDDVISAMISNGLWIDKGYPLLTGENIDDRSGTIVGTVTYGRDYSPGAPSTWITGSDPHFPGFSDHEYSTELTIAGEGEFNDNGQGFHGAAINSADGVVHLPEDTNPFGGDAVADLDIGPRGSNQDVSNWVWGTDQTIFSIDYDTSAQLLDSIWETYIPAEIPVLGETFLTGDIPGYAGLNYQVYYNNNNSHVTISLDDWRTDHVYGLIPSPSPAENDAHPDTLTTSLSEAPSNAIPLSNEMDVRNVIPDSNLDGIVKVPVDVSTFGPDTGSINFVPDNNQAEVYIPIHTDTWGGVPANAYLIQGAFAPAAGDGAPLTSSYWTQADASADGLDVAYSLDERLVPGLYINDPVNHIKRMSVVRPGGNVVTFDFKWHSSTESFDAFGYPIGDRDGDRTYVLHDLQIGASPDSTGYDLEFGDGIVHHFGLVTNSFGFRSVSNPLFLTSVSDFSGNTVGISTARRAGMTTASSARYNTTLNWQAGQIASLDYVARTPQSSNGAQKVRTLLDYAGDGLHIVGLDKSDVTTSEDMPSYSYSLVDSSTIRINGISITRTGAYSNNATSTVTIATSSSDNVYNTSDEYQFSSYGLLESVTHQYNGGSSTAKTSYKYQAATLADRYSANGSPKWAKITEIDNPDGSWEKFTYQAATGWMDQDITPFKGTQTINSTPDQTRVEQYTYDSSASGGGDPSNPWLFLERPRKVVETTRGLVTGITYYQYSGSQTTTRQVSDLSKDSWAQAVNQVITVRHGFDSPSDVSSAAGQTLYNMTPPDISGNRSLTITTYGPGTSTSGSGASIMLLRTTETMNAFGLVVHLVEEYMPPSFGSGTIIANVTSTYDGFGQIIATDDPIRNIHTVNDYPPISASTNWFGPDSVTTTDHEETDYTYDAFGRVKTSETNGITTTFFYDGDGHVVAQQTAGGNLTITSTSNYDAQGHLIAYTDPLGHTTTYSFTNTSDGVIGTATYHGSANATSTLISKTYLDGSSAGISGTSTDRTNLDSGIDAVYAPGSTIANPTGFWTRSIDNTNSTNTTANAEGVINTTYYNLLGQPYLTVNYDGQQMISWSQTYYDALGRVERTVNSSNMTIVTQYDPLTGATTGAETSLNNDKTRSNSISRYLFDATANQTVYQTVTTQADDPSSKIVDETSLDGLKSWHIDTTGTTTSATVLGSSPGEYTTTVTYPDKSQTITHLLNGLTDTVQQYGTFNGSGPATLISTTSYGYDDLLRNNAVTLNANNSTQTTRYDYQADGQIWRVSNPDTSTDTVTDWDPATNKPHIITNSNGSITIIAYNAKGEITSVTGNTTLPIAASRDPVSGKVTFTTSKNGTLDPADANNTATTIVQTAASSRDITTTYADGTKYQEFYLGTDYLQQVKAPGNVKGIYGYTPDHLQRLVSFSDGVEAESVSQEVTSFDRNGNPRVIQLNEGGTISTSSFDYNAANQLTYAASSLLPGISLNYNYTNGLEQKVSLLNSGATLASATYSYQMPDGSSRLYSITDQNSNATTFDYYAGTDQLHTMTTGNMVTTYDYDFTRDHLNSVTTNVGSTLMYKAAYDYPAVNAPHADQVSRMRVTYVDEQGTTQNYYVEYGYDTFSQLTSATTYPGVYDPDDTVTPSSTESFTYDDIGNRTTTGYASNIVNEYTGTPMDGSAISYDQRGNLITDSQYTYQYDAMDELIAVTPRYPDADSVQITYTYDVNGLRSSKTVSSGYDEGLEVYTSIQTTKYVYDGYDLAAEVNADTGKMIKSYTWDPRVDGGVGGLLSETTYDATGAVKATYLPLADANGNITGLIDQATGTVVVTYSYNAFGQCTSSAWTGTHDSSDPNPFRFSTHYQDENGLIYMGMRYYKADWGRFINRDPSGESGGANLFAYCGNDPINNVDPMGLDDTISTDYQKGLSQVATSSKYPWYLVTSAKYNIVSILVHTVFVDSTAMTSRGIRQAFPQAQAALTAQESTLSPDDTIGHLAISAGRVFTRGSEPITYGSFLLSEAGKLGATSPVAELHYVKPVVTFLKPTVPYVASGLAALQTAHVVAMPSNQRQIEDYMDLGALFGAAWMTNGAVSRSENIGSISEMEAAVRGESRGVLQLGMNGGSKYIRVSSVNPRTPVTGAQWLEDFSARYGATTWESRASAPVAKFSDYIFEAGADHGKDAVFRALGYSADDSAMLTKMWEQQAGARVAAGEYSFGKLNLYGQRIDIEIVLPGKGAAAGQTGYLRSGWMLQPDGRVTLNTPFTGFTR